MDNHIGPSSIKQNKRIINNTQLSINPNQKLRYKAIFGFQFLIENKIDFLNKKKTIEWEGVGISIWNETNPRNNQESNAQEPKNLEVNN